MTREMAVTEIVKIAVQISVETPKRRSPHAPSAYVSWDHVERLRELATILGYDLPLIRKRMDEIVRERRTAQTS